MGQYVFSVHFDPRPERDVFVPRLTREDALQTARLTMRAFTEQCESEGRNS